MVPPPTAVKQAIKANPIKSSCWRDATNAPDKANTKTDA
jgi:hypothetical protein